MKFDMPDPNCPFHYFSDIPLFDSLYICIYKGKDSGRGIGFEKQDCHSHGVFGILNLGFFGACGLDHLCHLAQCKAKLNVAF